jgi:hypothetical protein
MMAAMAAVGMCCAEPESPVTFISAPYDTGELSLQALKLNGPRMGMTYIINPNEALKKKMDRRNVEKLLSQFGWHTEWLIAPDLRGPFFVVQANAFIAGVEYNVAIPSATLMMGIRLPQGYEFGMGPSVVVTGNTSKDISSLILVALGKSLNFHGVHIPLNLVWGRNPEGDRVSFVFGYAMSLRDRGRK